MAADHVKIGGRSFAANDARVQMIYPNPLNPQRYVLVVASTSAQGMYLWVPDRLRDAEFDFTVEDGRVPAGNERISAADIRVAGGWFDHRWQVQDSLVIPGNVAVRSKAVVLEPSRAIDAKILDSYVGGYAAGPGMVIKVRRKDGRLTGQAGEQPEIELIPISDFEFFVVQGSAKITFEKDASGKVIDLKVAQGGREFPAKKIE